MAFISTKAHQKSNDGREAYLTAQRQATGQAASILRKKQAYAQISTANTSNDEHVGEAERYIRTVKERMRAIYSTLPFSKVP